MVDETAKSSSAKPSTEEAGKAAQAAADLGRGAAQTGSGMAQSGAAAAGQSAKAGTDAASAIGRGAAEAGVGMLGEITRLFADLKLPAVPDAQALLAAHRRNLEVLSAANRVALEGAQSVARRHMEIMQQTMSELTDQVRELTSPETPQAKAARQAEMLKRSYERAVANMRELGELIQRANGEALNLLNARFAEALDEVRGLLEQTAKQQQAR